MVILKRGDEIPSYSTFSLVLQTLYRANSVVETEAVVAYRTLTVVSAEAMGTRARVVAERIVCARPSVLTRSVSIAVVVV